jgi:hypothetical protein
MPFSCSGALKKKRESKAESAAAKAAQVNKRLHELQTLYWAELEYLHKEFTALEQKLIPEQEVRSPQIAIAFLTRLCRPLLTSIYTRPAILRLRVAQSDMRACRNLQLYHSTLHL